MQDEISKLCGKLVRADEQHELKSLAAELQHVIRHRVDSVRQGAAAIALFDRIVELDAIASEAANGGKTQPCQP